MRRTHPTVLIALAAAGVVVGFLGETAVATAGYALLVPPLSFPLTLVVVAALLLGFAIPIARTVRGASRRPINPFQATRVAILAKACALAGALIAGAVLGLLVYLLTRHTVPGGEALFDAILALAAGAVLLVSGLVAEFLCMVPPRDGDDDGEGQDA